MKKAICLIDTYKPKLPSNMSNFYDYYILSMLSKNIKRKFRRLSNQDDADIEILSLDAGSDAVIKDMGLKFEDSISFSRRSGYSRERSLASVRKIIINNPDFKDIFSENDILLSDVHELDIWDGYGDPIIKYIDLVNAALDDKDNKPDIVISFSDNIVSEIISEICVSRSIKFRKEVSGKVKLFRRAFEAMLPLGLSLFKPVFKLRPGRLGKGDIMENDHGKKLKLLFFIDSYSDDRIKEIIKEYSRLLSKLDKYDVIVIGLTDAAGSLADKAGFTFRKFSDYMSKEMLASYRSARKEFSRRYADFSLAKDGSGMRYRDINISKFMDHLFKYLFLRKFPETVLNEIILDRIFDAERPSAILLFDYSHPFAKTIAKKSSIFGVPSITLQHGVFMISPHMIPVATDRFFVYGDDVKKQLTDLGASSRKILVTGMPRSDDILLTKYNDERVKADLGIAKGQKILLFLSQPFDSIYNEQAFNILFKSLKNQQLKVIVKLHPTEKDSKMHEKIASDYGVDITVTKDHDLLELIHCADVVVSMTSTTMLDALIMKKPVISIKNPNIEMPNVLPNKAINQAKDAEEFLGVLDAIDKGKIQKSQKEHLKGTLYKLDKKVCDRIVQAVQDIIRTKSR